MEKKMLNLLKLNWGVIIEVYVIEFVIDIYR